MALLKFYVDNGLLEIQGFFIHCGFRRGSAGCIDVGGNIWGNSQTDALKLILQKSVKSTVWVL